VFTCLIPTNSDQVTRYLYILKRFRKIRKAIVSVLVPVRLQQLGSYWTDFHEIWYLGMFRKSFPKVQVSLKPDNNNAYFTHRPTHIYDSNGKGFPLQAWCGSWGSRTFGTMKVVRSSPLRHYEGGKVVTLKHRPSSPPGVFLVLIFRGWVDPMAHDSVGGFGKIPQRHHRRSIPRPSD
jgi:hypothetical protein